MARTPVPVTLFARTGVTPPAEVNGDSVNQHSIANAGKVGLIVRNAHATLPRNLTLRYTGTVDGQAIAPRIVAIPAVSTRWFGPFPADLFSSSVQIDVESADLKLTAIKIS